MLLELRDVCAGYLGIPVVRGVSLDVPEGSTVTIIGANGAGKTTLMRSISGVIRPMSGQIRFRGEEVQGLSSVTLVKKGVRLCPEGRGIFPELTVQENLSVGSYLRRDREGMKQDLDSVCQQFPVLRERSKQAAGTLSGGEQQMLAIARALMGRPALLLLDEPSLGLSPVMVQMMARTIQHIHSQGTAVLLVEQNSRMALNVSQYGYVMESGKIVLHGECRILLENKHVREAYIG